MDYRILDLFSWLIWKKKKILDKWTMANPKYVDEYPNNFSWIWCGLEVVQFFYVEVSGLLNEHSIFKYFLSSKQIEKSTLYTQCNQMLLSSVHCQLFGKIFFYNYRTAQHSSYLGVRSLVVNLKNVPCMSLTTIIPKVMSMIPFSWK